MRAEGENGFRFWWPTSDWVKKGKAEYCDSIKKEKEGVVENSRKQNVGI